MTAHEPEWEEVRRIFEAARALPSAERADFLRTECRGDEALERAVLRLLAADREDSFLGLDEPAAAGDAQAPERLGPIEILGELGRGGMGVVFRGYEPELDRDVAVKCLLGHLSLDEAQVERFRREAQAVARLHHPSIVPIHFVGQDRGHHFFAMEFLPGPDLGSELERMKLGQAPQRLPAHRTTASNGRIAELVADVADALQYAHDQGIVHRDIKPSNLIFGADGRITVVDFGLAQVESLGSLTRTDVIQGSPHYMSPEQARIASQKKVDHRTDVYSLGVVLYELLTLKRPFEGETFQEIFESIASREPPLARRLNPDVPRDLETICSVAMAKEPSERYATAGAFAADLRRFVEHRAILAKPPAALRRAWRAVLRHRKLVTTGLVGVGALVLGSWMRGELRVRATYPRLALEVRGRAGAVRDDAAGRVSVRRIDLLNGALGPPEPIGHLPLTNVRVEPGVYRVVVSFDNGAYAELFRDLPADGDLHELVAWLEPPETTAHEGMVAFEPTTFAPTEDECPNAGRPVELERFWLDRFEVTNAQYRRFLLATETPPPSSWADFLPGWEAEGLEVETGDGRTVAFDELPAVGMTWEDARAFAEWAGKRLPTHAELGHAGRGSELRLWPWADQTRANLGNVNGVAYWLGTSRRELWQLYLQNASPVGAQPEAATADGVHDLLGNVAELTETMHVGPKGAVDRQWFYALGGAWDAARTSQDLGNDAHSLANLGARGASCDTGLRCAKSAFPH